MQHYVGFNNIKFKMLFGFQIKYLKQILQASYANQAIADAKV
jgi:hypothetical protein